MKETGCVYLVGAGCGSADLITVRGLRLLQSCGAVVYDALIDPALLEEAPLAERYPAGKRSGSHSMPQEEISALLVRLAREGKTVVRLKGGDPFVFGRGGEEILALQEAGIPFEEVPGISSAVAIPAEAGIPVTHRELSRSFHVITGRTAAGGELLPESLQALAALQGTLVFLMGLGGLERIAAGLIAAGKSPQTPAAVVSGGNSPSPANLRGTLETIAEQARAAAVQAPAVIVVGETAALHLESGISRSLRGVSVGLTGTPAFAAKLADTLRPLGARTFPLLTARIRPLPLEFDLSRLGDGAGKWIVLTSANGVSCFFDLLNREKNRPALPEGLQICRHRAGHRGGPGPTRRLCGPLPRPCHRGGFGRGPLRRRPSPGNGAAVPGGWEQSRPGESAGGEPHPRGGAFPL